MGCLYVFWTHEAIFFKPVNGKHMSFLLLLANLVMNMLFCKLRDLKNNVKMFFYLTAFSDIYVAFHYCGNTFESTYLLQRFVASFSGTTSEHVDTKSTNGALGGVESNHALTSTDLMIMK